jgi:hypothetical protein
VTEQDRLNFASQFSPADRADLLAEAKDTVQGLKSQLGPTVTSRDVTMDAAANLLEQLNREVAQFGAYPDVLPLEEKNFTDHGWPVPPRFQDLRKQHKFYWLHFPLTIATLRNMPFVRLECAVEFNPGVADGSLRPRAYMIFPDRKFQQLLQVTDNLQLGINENFELEAETGKVEAGVGSAKAKGEAGVGGQAKGGLDLAVGPFTYTWKKAKVEHSPAGTEKVFWRLDGAEFFQEDAPNFIVVLQVPNAVNQVQIAAALQAYHQPNIGAMGPGEFLNYFTQRLRNFFKQGAPVPDKQVWDISSRL